MRPLPTEFRRRQAVVQSCLRAVPCQDMPLEVCGALFDAGFFVRLRPAEFSAFALAVAHVRYMQRQRQQDA